MRRIGAGAGLALALGVAGCASGEMLPEEIRGSNWAGAQVTPPGQELYPPAAQAQGVPGVVLMQCVMAADGRLADCEVIFENRPGWGFGAAGLRVAEGIRIPVGSIPVGATVLQPAGFCNDERGCRESRAELAAFRAEFARRSLRQPGPPDPAPAAGAVTPSATPE